MHREPRLGSLFEVGGEVAPPDGGGCDGRRCRWGRCGAAVAEHLAAQGARLAATEAALRALSERIAQLEQHDLPRQQMRLAPRQIIISGMTTGVALLAAGFALAKLFA